MAFTIYGPTFSTYVRTVQLTLAEKKLDFTVEDVNFLQGMPPEHFTRHPFGKVPAIDDNGVKLYETFAICRYIDEKYPEPALQPKAVEDRAKMTQVINILDSYTYNALITRTVIPRVVVPMLGGTTDEGVIEGAKADVEKSLSVLDEIIGAKNFIVGDRLSLADLHFVPIYTYYQLTPDANSQMETRHNIKRWFNAIKELDSVKKYCPPELK